jgi:hypothetical protein
MNNNHNQISGMEPNHNYTFKQQHISKPQEDFIIRNNSFIPSSTYRHVNNTNGTYLENMNDYGDNKINENFKEHNPIQNISDFHYKNNTLYPNLNENLLYQSIQEFRVNIDSMDRDIILYPDPFEYTVLFAPVVNSNIKSGSSSLKEDLRKADRMKNLNYKERKDIENIQNIQKSNSINNHNSNTNLNNPINKYNKYVIEELQYDDKTFNPYIINKFENIQYVKLDNVVLPKYSELKINEEWIYCNKQYQRHKTTGDELDRLQQCEFKYKRYVPNVNICSSLYSDRFIQLNIKELQNVKNLSTNIDNSMAFTIYPDKPLGVLYWRGNPYEAVRTYEKTLLGNINKFTMAFSDSWNKKLTLNLDEINYEIKQIKSTTLLNTNININLILDNSEFRQFVIEKMIEIIKCIVIINYDITNLIPFYSENKNISKLNQLCNFIEDVLKINKNKYVVNDIYKELNDFVTLDGFNDSAKLQQNGKSTYVNINEYITNIIFYDNFNDLNAMENILSLYKNYITFVYKIISSLKEEIFEIPKNKYFQNHLTFVFGVYKNELNTKINYEV